MRRRIVGIETEYGLTFFPTGKAYLPMEKVIGYLFEEVIPTGWPSNAFLPNGARFYQDTGCHPEYATPECASVRSAVIHDRAGERLLESRLGPAQAKLAEEGFRGRLYAYKNNTDTMGNTYGCHENYLVERQVDFWQLAERMIPFFVTRQIFCGAGKVFRQAGHARYSISQRATHIHEASSSSTTSSRSIINTRDEPHADAERYRRLHIIVGDSNMSEFTTHLKVGITCLLLTALEEGAVLPDLSLEDAVDALRQISLDLTLRSPLKLTNGRRMSALEMQWAYLEAAEHHFSGLTHGVFSALLGQWREVLKWLEKDFTQLADRLDWVAKYQLMQRFMERQNCTLEDPRVSMIDLQYHDIDRTRGLFYLLERDRRMVRLSTDPEVDHAMQYPPSNTRARIRGQFIRFAKEAGRPYSVDWTYLKLSGYFEETILCTDPFASHDPRVEELVTTATGDLYEI
ncbi:MAG: proteasome accessory factor PafA2 family protein [Nitrospirota bacterium]|nr:proteasome accessory factor PafA2 family protein [Nitrospirota bacterium]